MELKQGTFLHGGAYRIEQVLGQGSFGITYLAVHTALDKKVAIKEFFMKEINGRGDDGSITGMSDGSLSMNYARKFQKEALNLSRLEHPNIVRVTDSFEDNGTFYYVMDYIEGENLNEYVKHNYISRQEAVDIIRDVAKALMYMHEEKHMLHLDLKPGNIMRRSSDGHIFLIDFGLSKHYSSNGQPETSTTIGLGTAGYAPIEQANQTKNGEFRPTIDVYALGATFYKLLTRETPPAASELVSDNELLANNLKQHNINSKLSNVVVNAMLPSVRMRTQSVKEFLASLDSKKKDATSYDTIVPPANDKGNSINNPYIKDETIVENSSNTGEETVFAEDSSKKHLDFDESKYVIKTDYKKYPTSTKYKADNGDRDAMLALGMMALRGDGVIQDFSIAFSWFLKLKNIGDDRGEKLNYQWKALKDKYSTNKKDENKLSPQKESNNESVIVIGLIIIIGLICIFAFPKGCGTKVYSDSDNDTCAIDTVDTIAYTPTPVLDVTEEITPHKTKGNWRHSGTVITNYTQVSGLPICKSKIDKNETCKNGCIIGSGKGVVIIGKNSFVCEGISENIKSILEEYRSRGSCINDITITPQGKYVIIEGNNGYSNNTGIRDLDKELSRANSAKETIYSVSLTDDGKWAVITDAHYTSAGYFDVIETARKKYGEVRSVSMSTQRDCSML